MAILNFSEKISEFFHLSINSSIFLVTLLIIILFIIGSYLIGGLRLEKNEIETKSSKLGFLKLFISSLFSTIFFLFGLALLLGIPILYVKISDDGFNQPNLWYAIIVIIAGNYIFNKGGFFKAIMFMFVYSRVNKTFNSQVSDLGEEKSTTEEIIEHELIK